MTSRRSRQLRAAGAVVLVVLAGAVALVLAVGVGDDGDAHAPVVILEAPATTRPGTGAFPGRFVAATTDGRVVVATADAGVERELVAPGEIAGGAREVRGIAVAADGVAYVATCCDPAEGRLWRIEVVDGSASPMGAGTDVALSPDGASLAVLVDGRPELVDVGTGDRRRLDVPAARPGRDVAWSSDGHRLTWVRAGAADGPPVEVVVLDVDSGQTSVLPGPDEAEWAHPYANGEVLQVDEQCCRFDDGRLRGPATHLVIPAGGRAGDASRSELPGAVADRNRDPGGDWPIVTYHDGTVAWYGSGGAGILGRGYVSADW